MRYHLTKQKEMRSNSSIYIKFLITQCLVLVCVSQGFDFLYSVQQDHTVTQKSCCFPTTGKPASNFSIHGLWPDFKNASHPSFCNPNNLYNESKISDLITRMQISWLALSCPTSNGSMFWSHEWNKHGTCSEYVLDQHQYLEKSLNLKDQVDLLKVLECAGKLYDATGRIIEPNGKLYSLSNITEAITGAVGYEPVVTCNVVESGTSQLYEIYLCVDTSTSKLIECPGLPHAGCSSEVEFPCF